MFPHHVAFAVARAIYTPAPLRALALRPLLAARECATAGAESDRQQPEQRVARGSPDSGAYKVVALIGAELGRSDEGGCGCRDGSGAFVSSEAPRRRGCRILQADLQPGELHAAEATHEYESNGGQRQRKFCGNAATLVDQQ